MRERRNRSMIVHNASESSQLHFGLFLSNVLVGCVTALPIKPTEAKVRQMAVSSPHQRRGCGSIMMRSLESELVIKGYTLLSLHARVVALGFYEKLGYLRLGSEFFEVGIPHVKMEKSLVLKR